MKKPSLNLGSLGERFAHAPRVALIAVGVIALAALGARVILDHTADDGAATGAEAAWNEGYRLMAMGLASDLEAAIAPYRDATAAIAGDPRVAAAMTSDAPAALDALAAELRPALPGVLALRLLPADVRDPQSDQHPPLTYASISMIRHAREGDGAPPMEIHLAGDPDEHMVFLRRVDDDAGTALGFVHLSVSPAVVRDAFAAETLDGAHAEIRQGPRLRVAANGRAPAADVPAIVLPVKGTILSVAVQAEAAAAGASKGGPPLLPAALVLVALLGAFLWYRRRPAVRVGKVRTAGDAVIYQGAIRAILDGAHPGLEQLLPRARGAHGAPPAAALDALARADGEDVTTFGGGIVVDEGDEDPTVPREDAAFDLDLGDLESTPTTPAASAVLPVPASIFRSYDIRGIVGETLTEDGVYQIGRALGAEAEARGQQTVVVARDGRHSSEDLLEALNKGLLESGREVLDIGLTPTPVLYFATHYLDARSGVMITGSHNPAEYNGLKIVLDGETLSGEAIQAVRRRVEEQDFIDGTGQLQSTDIIAEYIRRISEEIPVSLGKALRVVVDCGNGVPGMVAPDVLRAIGHDVVELFCEVDGDFPNHHPDPSQPANLAALIDAVADEGADIGLAFDGDGDRLGVVDSDGNIIWPDRQMLLFARDILAHNPGAKIIYDVKCSSRLPAEIEALGGEPIMARSGHSLIKAKMQETGALLAGEMSGHIFFKDRWYGFDDAIYAAARLLEIVVNSPVSASELFAGLPGGVATPELHIPMPEERHAEFMREVVGAADFPGARMTTLDGLRVDFDDSWGLVRPSNTTPCLVLRFEGDDEAALEGVKERFRSLLMTLDANLDLPF